MKPLIEAIVQALVDKPDEVQIKEVIGDHAHVLELRVAKDDLGKVIGKVRVMLIEFSYKNTAENYAELVGIIAATNKKWVCYDSKDLETPIPLVSVIDHFTNRGAVKKPFSEFWFIRQ